MHQFLSLFPGKQPFKVGLNNFCYLIIAVFISISAQAQTTLLPYGSSWRYLDNGTNQKTAWTGTGFDDASWVSGDAQLGYGDGDEATVVSYGSNASAVYITTYFRKSINISNVNAFSHYVLNMKRDDGAVVYINGIEVWRSNMPIGTVAYNTLASRAHDDGTEVQTLTLTRAASMLVSGNNTIAVEIHQQAANSSDISFDFQLQGQSEESTIAVTRGPYLQKLSTSSVVLRWRTNVAANSKVTYGTSPANLNLSASVSGTRTEHTVALTGLASGTKYYYSIGTGTKVLQSGTANNFLTAPVSGTPGKYTFWAIGDCGSNNTNQQNVLNAYNSYIGNNPTHGWLLLGDNAYESGTDAQYTTGFFNKYQSTIMKNAPLFPAPGNHDLYSGSGPSRRNAPYFSIFDLPTNGECGGVASNDEGYYSWDYGNIHFLSLESYASVPSLSDTLGLQALWVKKDLASNTKEWVVAYWHHPPYTMTSHNSDTEGDLVAIREKFVKWIEKLGVDLVICGHSHGYERSKLMKGNYGKENTFDASVHNLSSSSGLYDGTTNSCPYFKDAAHPQGGTVYVVAGSSGKVGGTAASYPHAAMHTSNNTEGGSLILEFDGNRLDAKWLKANGSIGDKFTIIKNSNKKVHHTINSGESVNLSASWNGGSYVWSTGATEKSTTVNPTSNSTYVVRDEYSCVADTFNIVVQPTNNLGFENNFTSWFTYGTASIDMANVRSGSKSGYFSNGGGNYEITGLTPGASYSVKGWVKAVSGTDTWIVVTGYDGEASTGQMMTSTSWTQSGDIVFTMGANNTSATLAAWTGNGSSAYFDDFTIEPSCTDCRMASTEAESSKQTEAFTLQLHPNPASREVTISLAGFEGEPTVQVKMMDIAGKPFVMKQVQIAEGDKQVTLPVSHLPQGLFFVMVKGSKTTKSAKLVITK
jgi:hypothetical protein